MDYFTSNINVEDVDTQEKIKALLQPKDRFIYLGGYNASPTEYSEFLFSLPCQKVIFLPHVGSSWHYKANSSNKMGCKTCLRSYNEHLVWRYPEENLGFILHYQAMLTWYGKDKGYIHLHAKIDDVLNDAMETLGIHSYDVSSRVFAASEFSTKVVVDV